MTKWLAVVVLVVAASACKDEPKKSKAQELEERARADYEKLREKAKDLGQKAGSSAEAMAEEAKARAKAFADQLAPLQQHLIDLDQRISKAVEDVTNADSESARSAAKGVLDRLIRQKKDLEQKLSELRTRLESP